MARRQYAGGAAQLTVNSGTVAAGDTSFTVSGTTTGWPDGSVGPFAVALNRGKPDEEKALCSARTGTTFTITTRGYDGTTAQSHANGTTVDLVITAVDADEANAHVNASSGVHGLAGSVVGTSDAQTLTNKTLTSPIIAQIRSGGQTLTLPAATDTLVARATTDSLSNKTLVSPVAVAANNASNPLSLQGVVGQAADLFDISTSAALVLAVSNQGALVLTPTATAGIGLFVTNLNAAVPVATFAGASTPTADIVQVQSGGVTNAAFDKNGHLCGRGSGPGLAAGTGAGTTPPAPVLVNASDQGGFINIGTGSGSPTAGQQVVVTFNRAYATAPAVLVWAANDATSALLPFAPSPNVTTTGFQVFFHTAPGVSQSVGTYRVGYVVIGN